MTTTYKCRKCETNYYTVTVLGPVLLYEFFLKLKQKLKQIEAKTLDLLFSFTNVATMNETSVATFVPTLIKTFDTADLDCN